MRLDEKETERECKRRKIWVTLSGETERNGGGRSHDSSTACICLAQEEEEEAYPN